MQNKLVIAALLGLTNASIKHRVQSIQGDIVHQMTEIQHGIEDTIDVVHQIEGIAEDVVEDSLYELSGQKTFDAKKAELITMGILEGAIKAEGLDNVEKCLADAKEVVGDAEAAFKDFETKDPSKIIDGIKVVADLVKTIKSGMVDCKGVVGDWKKLEAMVEVFASPESFAYHVGKDLLINGVDIYHEIQDAVTQYKAGNWEQFGSDVGEALAKTLLGQESLGQLGYTDDQIKLAQIEQGILKAYGGKFDVLSLLQCIGDEDKALLMFDMAVQQFVTAYKQKNPQDAIAGVIATVAGVQQFKAGLPECESIDTTTFNFKGLDAAYDIAAHPTEHFELLEEDLLINGVAIKHDLKKAVKAYRKGEYAFFGFYMGEVLKLVSNEKEVEEPVKDVEDIFNRKMATEVAQGILSGTQVGSFDFTKLLTCIYEADQSALVLYQAVETLEEAYKDKSPQEAVGGIIETVAFVQGLKQTIPVCESMAGEEFNWSHFNHIVDVVESPEKHMEVVEYDIMFNKVKITNELSQALDAFRSENFNEFGYKLGQTLFLATEEPAGLTLY